ncbi:MAG: hypothetical protein JW958_11895 [Candidatus Eisenbacteria bacterium]|nr:hypothetical protein [Candidatus Eisenbacteria bacterium]
MRKRRRCAAAFLVALLAGIACSVHILEPDHHCRSPYSYHSARGYDRCADCHGVVMIRVYDTGCWDCH